MFLRYEYNEPVPGLRQPHTQATVVHEVDLELPVEENAPEHHLTDTLRVSNGVEKREGRAPRAANHPNRLKAEMLPEQLDISDEKLRGIVRRLSERRTQPAAALIEKDHVVLRKIVERQVVLVEVRTRATMKVNDRGVGVPIATFFEIDRVATADMEVSATQQCLVFRDKKIWSHRSDLHLWWRHDICPLF